MATSNPDACLPDSLFRVSVMLNFGEPGTLRTKLMLLVRYGIAGSITSGVYILVYNIFVHFDVVRFLSSNLAYLAALMVQYNAHGKFTFGHRDKRKGVLWRYLVAVGFGFVMAALISQANTKLYTLPDVLVSLIVMVLVATSNFFFFNFWVYAHNALPIRDDDDNG
jgi:putative flippase GtrA